MTASMKAGAARALRVCLVVPYDIGPEAGGVKQHALHLMAALRTLGDEVWLIGPTTQTLTTPGLHGFRGVVNVPANGSDNQLGLLVSPLQVWRFFRRHRFDVIHLHEPQGPLLPYWVAWLTPGIARVATFHAYAENDSTVWGRKLSGRCLFPWVHRGIAVSKPAARYAAVSWRRALTIVPNGVCAKVFRPPTELTPGLSEAGPLRLMFVGRLADSRKGARYILEAFARLRKRGVNVSLDMVGQTAGYGPLPTLPGLTYHNEVSTDDLARRYRDTDVLVAPATGQESFGIILLEAMASAKPVICSDIDGYRSVIAAGGARTVPPADADALTDAIAAFAALPTAERLAMGQVNAKHAQQFHWDSVVHKVRNEYLAAIDAA
jgi:phosphatidylinositol alpha-mannosyltransferase